MNNQSVLYINSKDRSNGVVNNFNYNLPVGINDAYSYYVKNVVIPFSAYVSVYPQNDTQSYVVFIMQTSTGESHNVSLPPPGNYTANQLAAAIQSDYNSTFTSNQITVTYNSNTNKFTFAYASGTATQIKIYYSSNNNEGQEIMRTLGFPTVGSSALAGSLTSTYAANLTGPLNYFLQSSCFTVGDCVSFFQNTQSSTILQIPVVVNPGGIIYYENPINDFIPLRKKNLNNIDLSLVDDYGNPVLLNGLDYSITIVISNRNNF